MCFRGSRQKIKRKSLKTKNNIYLMKKKKVVKLSMAALASTIAVCGTAALYSAGVMTK